MARCQQNKCPHRVTFMAETHTNNYKKTKDSEDNLGNHQKLIPFLFPKCIGFKLNVKTSFKG